MSNKLELDNLEEVMGGVLKTNFTTTEDGQLIHSEDGGILEATGMYEEFKFLGKVPIYKCKKCNKAFFVIIIGSKVRYVYECN